MTDDLVERLRDSRYDGQLMMRSKAADRIEELERAVLDLAQYTSHADLCFYIEPKTRKILNEIEEKTK